MLKNVVTLKLGLKVTRGHWKWCRSIDCIRVLIVVFFSNIMILLEVNEFKKVCNCHILTTVDVLCFHLIVSFRFYRAMLCKRGLCCHVVYVCLFVCLSVRPSHSWITSKRINISSHFFHCAVAQSF